MRRTSRAILCLSITLTALCALVTSCNLKGDDTIAVPIKIVTDREVSAVIFEVVYDPAVLQATKVDLDSLAQGSKSAYGTEKPGRLYVQVLDAPNIDRNGTLVVAHFKVLDEAGSSILSIDFKGAEDRNTNELLPFETSDGRVVGTDMSVEAPVITIG